MTRRWWPRRDVGPTLEDKLRERAVVAAATDAEVVAMLERIEATNGEYLNTLGLIATGRLFTKALLILLRRP